MSDEEREKLQELQKLKTERRRQRGVMAKCAQGRGGQMPDEEFAEYKEAETRIEELNRLIGSNDDEE